MSFPSSPPLSDRLSIFRQQLQAMGFDGFVVAHADEFLNEFTPPSAERLAWLTGFTGSYGAAVILPDKAVVMSDGRYTIQLRKETDPAKYENYNIMKTGAADWLLENGKPGLIIGYDSRFYTPRQSEILLEKVTQAGMVLRAVEQNPIDLIWPDRLAGEEIHQVELFPERYAGLSSTEKRASISAQLREKGLSSAVITVAASIAWLLNIRGHDLPHTPFALSYAILHAQGGQVDWFIDPRKVPAEVSDFLGGSITIHPIQSVADALRSLKGKVLFDYQRSPQWFLDRLQESKAEIHDGMDPCIMPTALKTPEEQAAMRAAHIRDGVALTKLLYWFDQNAASGTITELDIVDKLFHLRSQQDKFRFNSFDTIAAWGKNASMAHYRPAPETNLPIQGDNMLLLDSGGQYSDGTTDVTRTVGVGTPSAEMKDRFTRILKGHIAVSRLRFPEGTTGVQIDALARAHLWQVGMDFTYGTGHGVGCFLSVHEESTRLSPRSADPVRLSMILSNEPGYHKKDEYGIRTENLALCIDTGETMDDGRRIFAFEPLTLAPYDLKLVDWPLITADEKRWLKGYLKTVMETLSPFLDPEEQQWLKENCIINE